MFVRAADCANTSDRADVLSVCAMASILKRSCSSAAWSTKSLGGDQSSRGIIGISGTVSGTLVGIREALELERYRIREPGGDGVERVGDDGDVVDIFRIGSPLTRPMAGKSAV